MNSQIHISSCDLNGILSLLEDSKMLSSNIAALEEELVRANVVDKEAIPKQVVTMNSTVVFKFVGENKVYIKKLVYPVDIENYDDISILAPVGSALIGMSKGQTLNWLMPNKTIKTIKVINVIK
ncbi:nucleoside diphosphate kinase regulator [Shewanella corallii]|uniref:Nucleoside diphosphate kinase regulator n=2 Tax=Shewanella TaxID=22 RepID=A0ABT0NEF7_9GAMM|nr:MULTISPECIES: nucleoside diphosphate kinase regulator [Shewanella]MCL1038691.1 nucleoside diphosphate kinase regulator [Shewanella submarina]MCL2916525.1 nucleoside diphosphate kinase regulator [Shewanella corallii]